MDAETSRRARKARSRTSGWGRGLRRGLIFAVATLVVLVAVVVLWVLFPRSPSAESRFLARKGSLIRVDVRDRTVRDGMVSEDLVLVSDTGLEVCCLVRSPATGQEPVPEGVAGPLPAASADRLPAVILMGGIESGRFGLLRLATERYPFLWLSLDYSYELPRELGGVGAARRELPRAVEGVEKTVAGILLARDYLETRPDVDVERVVAGGGSLGTFVTVLAAAVDVRFGAVVLLYGGGDVARIIEHNLSWESGILKRWAAEALNPWLGPLEPARHVARIAPRPLLMVNGTGDRMFPRRCVDTLFEAAGKPKKLVWLETPHRIVDDPEQMNRALVVAMDWLVEHEFLDGGGH